MPANLGVTLVSLPATLGATLGLICRGNVRVAADLAVTLLFMPANLGATLVSIYTGNMRVLLGRSLAQPSETLTNVNKPRPRL